MTIQIEVTNILPSPTNPRKRWVGIDELAKSMLEVGQLEPIMVRELEDDRDGCHFELVFGERRWRAAKLAGFPEIEASLVVMTDLEVRAAQFRENVERADLSPLEKADAVRALLEQGVDIADAATRLGLSEGGVRNLVALSDLIAPLRALMDEGRLRDASALLLASLAEPVQVEVAAELANGALPDHVFTRGEIASAIEARTRRIADAPFDAADPQMIEGAPACTSCPKNTATQLALLAEVDAEARCLTESCWRAKCDAAWWDAKDAASKRALRVLTDEEALEVVAGGKVRPDASYVALSDRVDAEAVETWREVVPEDSPYVVARDVDTGRIFDLLPRAAAANAIRDRWPDRARRVAREPDPALADEKAEKKRERKAAEIARAAKVAAMSFALAQIERTRTSPNDQAWDAYELASKRWMFAFDARTYGEGACATACAALKLSTEDSSGERVSAEETLVRHVATLTAASAIDLAKAALVFGADHESSPERISTWDLIADFLVIDRQHFLNEASREEPPKKKRSKKAKAPAQEELPTGGEEMFDAE